MPDYNPDKEAHRDHGWIVHKATRDKSFKGVTAAEKKMPFNKEGRFMVNDPAVAAEIRKNFPKNVTVTRVNKYHPADRGHRYHFVCPAMPWHKDEK
jgi:hypothetical protein